eukprot:s120_g22.t1
MHQPENLQFRFVVRKAKLVQGTNAEPLAPSNALPFSGSQGSTQLQLTTIYNLQPTNAYKCDLQVTSCPLSLTKYVPIPGRCTHAHFPMIPWPQCSMRLCKKSQLPLVCAN